MRILRVITSMDPAKGGPVHGIYNSIPSLRARGCENEVICLDDPTRDAATSPGFPIHTLGKARGPWRSHPRLAPWLDANLHRFDALIVHGLWEYHSFAVTRAVRRSKRGGAPSNAPVTLVMPHGMLDPWFQRDPSRRVKAVRNAAYWRLIEKRTIAEADAVLFTCQRELELARGAFRAYHPQREINAGYGVARPPAPTEGMRRAFQAACPAADPRRYLLCLGRVHPKKGIDLLIEGYTAEATRRGLDATPDLVIAGPLDSAYAERMVRLADDKLGPGSHAAAAGVRRKVHFPGMLQGDAKWGAIYGCEAFILPSHQENFGIAIVEALACGRPVLISDQVNICEEVARAGAGVVGADTQAGVQGMLTRWLGQSREQRQAMSPRAFACYEDHFLPDAAAERLIGAIETCRAAK